MMILFLRMESPPTEETLTPVDLNLIKDLWVPNVFIYNLKTFKVMYSKVMTMQGKILIVLELEGEMLS